jgi:hypothetical protein
MNILTAGEQKQGILYLHSRRTEAKNILTASEQKQRIS